MSNATRTVVDIEVRYAETDQEVSIEDNTSRTTAASMQGFLNDGRFYFFSDDKRRVNTVIWPRSE